MPSADVIYYCQTCDAEVTPRGPGRRCPIDGSTLYRIAKQFRPGTVVAGRYTLRRPLGRGGMGLVFLAAENDRGRDVALKVVSGDNPITVKRFLREARASSRVLHPRIVTVYDVGQFEDGRPYMAMELLDGLPLSDIIATDAPLEPGRAAHIASHIAEALVATHAQSILHRDLKPDNVFVRVDDDGVEQAKVLDFGLAKTVDGQPGELGTLTAQGLIIGTPHYMSPEQCRCWALTPATDIYSLGCVLFEMLTGRIPFQGRTPEDLMHSHIGLAPPTLAGCGIVAPQALEDLLAECLSKNAEERPTASNTVLRLREIVGIAADGTHKPPATVVVTPGSVNGRPTLSVNRRTTEEVGQRFRPTLVGRSELRRGLHRLLEECFRDRKGMVVRIEGTAGIGKSKLVEWYRGRVLRAGGRPVVGYRKPDDGPLAAIREALEVLFEIEGANRAAVERALASQEAKLSAFHRRLVADFLRPTDTPALRGLSPEDERLLTYAAVVRALIVGARKLPTVVVLEGLRDTEPFAQEFLDELGEQLAATTTSLLFVFVVRTDGDSNQATVVPAGSGSLPISMRDRYHLVRVQPMRHDEMVELLHRALPGLDARATRYLTESCGGHPRHALELLRHLVAVEALTSDEGLWSLTTQPSTPAQVDSLVLQRLAAIDSHSDGASLLIRAAILGENVQIDVLTAMLEREGQRKLVSQLDDVIHQLVCDGWLRHEERNIVLFEHELIRERIVKRYGTTNAARRLHMAAGEAWETRHAGHIEDIAGNVARHFDAAGSPSRALGYALIAAGAAETRHDTAGALAAWETAARILDRVVIDERATKIRCGLAGAYLRCGQLEKAEEALLLAGAEPEVLELRGDLAEARGDSTAAIEKFALAATTLRARGQDVRAAQTDLKRATTLRKVGALDDAAFALEETLRRLEARREDTRWLRAEALSGLAIVGQLQGRLDDAVTCLAREEVLRRDLGDPVALGRALYARSGVEWRRGNLDAALQISHDSAELLEAAGHVRGLAHALRAAGAISYKLGNLEQSKTYSGQAWKLFERLGDSRGQQRVSVSLADVAYKSGDLAIALGWARRAAALAEELADPDAAASAFVAMADISMARRDPRSALEYLEDAWRHDSRVPEDRWRTAYIQEQRGNALQALGDEAGASKKFQDAIAIYERTGNAGAAQTLKSRLKVAQDA